MPEFVETMELERDIICKYCGNTNLCLNGSQNGEQYYLCKKCGHRATGKDTYPHQRYDRDTIIQAMTYYYNGMSYGAVKNTFDDLEQLSISKATLWSWIMKYTDLIIPFSRDIKPMNIGDIWVADETMIMMHGRNKWLWACIDEQTRYLLACHLSQSRGIKDATVLFREAYLHAGKKPLKIITDKLPAYHDAYKKVFWTRSISTRPSHAQSAGFISPTNQNLIERWHEYIKQRTKIMRHFKLTESAKIVLNGIIINYNYLWEHSSIGHIPPAQMAGIDLVRLGIKNWGDLIELAIEFKNEQPKRNPQSFTFWLDEQIRLGRC